MPIVSPTRTRNDFLAESFIVDKQARLILRGPYNAASQQRVVCIYESVRFVGFSPQILLIRGTSF